MSAVHNFNVEPSSFSLKNVVLSLQVCQSLNRAAVEAVCRQRGMKNGQPASTGSASKTKRHSVRVSAAAAQDALLTCPLSSTRIQTPVRGTLCQHDQAIDLKSFLDWASILGKPWACPICTVPMSSCMLVWDQRVQQLLSSTAESSSDKRVHGDGGATACAGDHATDDRRG